MTTYTIVFYRQYQEWSCTKPFKTQKAAERHADIYLRSDEIKDADGKVLAENTRAHISDITFLDVELPD